MNSIIINMYENENQLLCAAIDKITVEIINKKNNTGAQVIAITSCSPVAGTTSTAISLSIAMAATARKTLLIDCDVRKAGIYKKLNDQAGKGLTDYVSGNFETPVLADDLIYPTNVNNLFYISGGIAYGNPTRILCSERVDDLICELRNTFDCIILDLPSISVVPDAQIMFRKVDGIIVVAALGETKRSQIKDTRQLISSYKEKYYGMIINKIPKDIYRKNVKNADYYLTDKNGKQRFDKNKAYKKHKTTESESNSFYRT
ncbi:MAG: CpsD/CapB family tyrosine-protein kinase [Lachnospiraceae bacterium]|nr:CpsD/CapB family tyrosine-protein kinase [Lachnospiraceae bacterium]